MTQLSRAVFAERRAVSAGSSPGRATSVHRPRLRHAPQYQSAITVPATGWTSVIRAPPGREYRSRSRISDTRRAARYRRRNVRNGRGSPGASRRRCNGGGTGCGRRDGARKSPHSRDTRPARSGPSRVPLAGRGGTVQPRRPACIARPPLLYARPDAVRRRRGNPRVTERTPSRARRFQVEQRGLRGRVRLRGL